MAYRVKNWHRFQHFKDRRPPWIKLYRELLDDPDWHELDSEASKALVMLWLIASEDDGRLPDLKKIAFRLRIGEQKAKTLIGKLSHWLEQDDINEISERHQSDAPETETETETETEKNIVRLKPDLTEQAKEVLSFLNDKTGRHYEPVRETLDPILARLKGGSSVEDLRAVIAKKTREWGADEKMQKYLRPKTLFNATNFANYKGELEAA